MARFLFPGCMIPALSTTGEILSGAKMYVYLNGGTTPTSSWNAASGGSTNTNPIVANSAGRFGPVYLDVDTSYRIKVTNADGSDTLYDRSPVTLPISSNVALYTTLAGTGGADLIGTALGGTVQDELDALRTYDDSWQIFRPEDYGAVGDDTTNDTDAFGLMSQFVEAAGGGVIWLSRKVYLVGKQTLNGTESGDGFLFDPSPIIDLEDCSTVIIRGNGAILRCPTGMKYGAFNSSGVPIGTNASISTHATPYKAMISVERCTGPLVIENIELDGNAGTFAAPNITIGGQSDSSGWQIGCDGISLVDNSGPRLFQNVYSHHHCRDGFVDKGDATASSKEPARYVNCRAWSDGRNGFSLVGGSGVSFENCSFKYNAWYTAVASAPGAGIDLEAENTNISAISFENCEFIGNRTSGMVSDNGSTWDVDFKQCTFLGTSGACFFLRAGRFRFDDCTFHGSCTRGVAGTPLTDTDAAYFNRCRWYDDPSVIDAYLSGIGATALYGAGGTIYDLGGGDTGVFFNYCQFLLTNDHVAPYTGDTTQWYQCTIEQASAGSSHTQGAFYGRNIFTTAGTNLFVDVDTLTKVKGDVIYNGVSMTHGTLTVDVPSIAAGGISAIYNIPVKCATPKHSVIIWSEDALPNIFLKVYVMGGENVGFQLINNDTGPVDPGSTTYHAKVQHVEI